MRAVHRSWSKSSRRSPCPGCQGMPRNPAVGGVCGDDYAAGGWVADAVDHAGPVTGVVAQRRAEQDANPVAECAGPGGGDPGRWRTALCAPSAPMTYRARIVVEGPGEAATVARIAPSAGRRPTSSAPYRSWAPAAAARLPRMASRWSCAHAHTWPGKGTRCISGPVRQERIDIACSQSKPRRRTSGSAPQRLISCMVSAVSAVARGWLPGTGWRSRISGASPGRPVPVPLRARRGPHRRPGPGLVLVPDRSRETLRDGSL